MADTLPFPAAADTASFNLQRVYLQDLSLEMPNAPHIFLEQAAPQIEVQITVGGQGLTETMFESTVTATLTTRINDKVLYLIEATQAGIFELVNIPLEQRDPLLGIVCPTILYPYLRTNVADAITRTSFPALHLAEVNFQALYEQRLSELAQSGEQALANNAEASFNINAMGQAPAHRADSSLNANAASQVSGHHAEASLNVNAAAQASSQHADASANVHSVS